MCVSVCDCVRSFDVSVRDCVYFLYALWRKCVCLSFVCTLCAYVCVFFRRKCVCACCVHVLFGVSVCVLRACVCV